MMRRPSLKRIVSRWQRILRLQEWDIETTYASMGALGGAYADIRPDFNLRVATMRVGDPKDYVDCVPTQDVESAVVHELLHLWLDEDASQQERAINNMTKAYLELERAK